MPQGDASKEEVVDFHIDILALSTPLKEDIFLGRHDFPIYILKNNVRRECMARMKVYHRKNSNWLIVNMEIDDTSGKPLLHVRSELLGYLTRNVVINGCIGVEK